MKKNKKDKKKKFVISNKHAQKIINKALKNNFVLWIKTSAWGNRKALSRSLLKEKFQDNAKALSGAQKLVDHEEVKNVISPINKVMTFIRNNSYPWLTDGVYFVTEDKVLLIDEECKKAREEIKERRKEFRKKFAKLKSDHKENFPELYNESYYPSEKEVEMKFDFIWGWQKIELPFAKESKVTVISEDMMKAENDKFQEIMKGVAEETIIMIRGTFFKLVSGLRDKLKDPDKKFKNVTIEKPIQFLESLKDINIYNDKPFMEISESIKNILKGIDIDDLREDKKYRKKMGNKVNEIVKEFEDLPVVKYRRALEI